MIRIPEKAFAYCDVLKSIKIPDSVVEIGYMAFGYCSNLSHVDLSSQLKIIGNSAFLSVRTWKV